MNMIQKIRRRFGQIKWKKRIWRFKKGRDWGKATKKDTPTHRQPRQESYEELDKLVQPLKEKLKMPTVSTPDSEV